MTTMIIKLFWYQFLIREKDECQAEHARTQEYMKINCEMPTPKTTWKHGLPTIK